MACALSQQRLKQGDELYQGVPALPNGAALDKDVGWWRSLWYVGCALCHLKEAAAERVRFAGEEVEEGDVFRVVDAWEDFMWDEKRWRRWKAYADKYLPKSLAELLTRDNIELFVRYYYGIGAKETVE